MHLIFNGKFKSNQECFCDLGDKCIEIQSQFRKINDLRGQTQLMPNPKKDSKKHSDLNKLKYQKHCVTHRIEAKKILNEKDWNKINIALWHFDKRLLALLGEDYFHFHRQFH